MFGKPCERKSCDHPVVSDMCDCVWKSEDLFYLQPWSRKYLDPNSVGEPEDWDSVFEEWHKRLIDAYPDVTADGYRDPPAAQYPPGEHPVVLQIQGRVALYSKRWGNDPDRPKNAIWHKSDCFIGHKSIEKVGIIAAPTINGEYHQGGLSATETEMIAEEEDRLDCDPAMTERLERIDILLRRE